MDLKERYQIAELKRHPWEMLRGKVIADILRHTISDNCHILDIRCRDLFSEEYLSPFYPNVYFSGVDIAFASKEISASTKSIEM